ncbi:MAG: restriction endonuclease subunit S [Acidimicrobiales bacterium]|nr:restriction endonuclease subunit S [Acidimicrobiales bacterium]
MTRGISLHESNAPLIDLRPDHLAVVSSILNAHVSGRTIRAYGSRTKWSAREHSDLDLVVMGESPLGPSALAKLREAFEDSDLPFSVDVLDWSVITQNFRREIEGNYVTLLQTPDTDSWMTSSVGEFTPLSYGKALPKRSRVAGGSVDVYGSSGVVGQHNQALTHGPTVVIGRKGTVGSVNFSPTPCWPIDTTFYCEDEDQELARFKYYVLSALGLERMNTDSAVPGLNRNNAHLVRLRLPPIDERRRIASVLGTLDDRIELDSQLVGVLESIAAAIYQAWFVDFEPVRAKVEGRWRSGESLPGLPARLFALFPSALVDSELGPIPADWPIIELGEVANTTHGRSYRSAELEDSDIALVTLKSFARGGGYRTGGLKPYTGKYKPEQVIAPGETVIACTDVSQDASVIGRSARIPVSELFTNQVASLDAMILRSNLEGPLTREWIYLLTRTQRFEDYLKGHTSGTTVLHLDKSATLMYRFPYPGHRLIREFVALVAPFLQRSSRVLADFGRLEQLRNVLLPKLVSGEIRLRGATEVVNG